MTDPEEYLAHFQARVLQDALDQATVHYWLQRHAALSGALPRPGDFTGHASPGDLQAAATRIRRSLVDIERHIQLLEHGEISPEIWNVVRS